MGAAEYQKYRRKAGISPEQAAVKLGISVATLSNYERGKTSPNAITLKQMARMYGCRSADLIGA